MLPIALLGKTLYDSAVALKLGAEEWQENKKLCAYCQAATVVSLASVALAAPEALRAARRLMHDGQGDTAATSYRPDPGPGRLPERSGWVRERGQDPIIASNA